MTNQERINIVLDKINSAKPLSKFRVYFKNFERAPQFGKFVDSEDKDEIFAKGFIRFVSDSKEHEYDLCIERELFNRALNYTRMLKIDEINDVREFAV